MSKCCSATRTTLQCFTVKLMIRTFFGGRVTIITKLVANDIYCAFRHARAHLVTSLLIHFVTLAEGNICAAI